MPPSASGSPLGLVAPLQAASLSEKPTKKPGTKSFKLGLDYGTTYSAGAFCLCSSSIPEAISGEIYPFFQRSETSGPGYRGNQLSSVILYENNESVKIGADAENLVSLRDKLVRKAKLGLDYRPETVSARQTLQQDIERLTPKTETVEVIADYLGEMFIGFKIQLERIGYCPGDSIELNCAIPSIWTDQARHSMVQAIEIASRVSGLPFDSPTKLWPEAEAATEHVLKEQRRVMLQKGDVFVVCDAGGGTVDLTTYLVHDPDIPSLQEVVESTGGLCGSTFIDDAFYELIEKRTNDCQPLKASMSKGQLVTGLRRVLHVFKTQQKLTFSRRKIQTYEFELPMAPELREDGFLEDVIQVESRDLIPIFETVSEKIWDLLRSQLEQVARKNHVVKYVLSTGGLSNSEFVDSYLKEKLACEPMHVGIRLVHVTCADYSVAWGAIRCSQKNADDARTRRISTRSIGVPYSLGYKSNPPFTDADANRLSKIHSEKNKLDNLFYIPVIEWLVTKGDEQPETAEMKLHQYIPFDASGDYEISIPLMTCDHVCRGVNPKKYYEENSQECFEFGTVHFNLDMSIIKARLKPVVRKRKQPRTKKTYPALGPRRSSRISERVENDKPAHPSNVTVPRKEPQNAGQESLTHHPVPSPQPLTSSTEELNGNTDKYYDVQYRFEMRFHGLQADFHFRCQDAEYDQEGTIKLPNYYRFRGSEDIVNF